jgi:hypothetical protein
MQIEGNTPIKLDVTLDTVHVILTALGTLPYDRVVAAVASIQAQAAQQIKALQDAGKENPAAPPTPPQE